MFIHVTHKKTNDGDGTIYAVAGGSSNVVEYLKLSK